MAVRFGNLWRINEIVLHWHFMARRYNNKAHVSSDARAPHTFSVKKRFNKCMRAFNKIFIIHRKVLQNCFHSNSFKFVFDPCYTNIYVSITLQSNVSPRIWGSLSIHLSVLANTISWRKGKHTHTHARGPHPYPFKQTPYTFLLYSLYLVFYENFQLDMKCFHKIF